MIFLAAARGPADLPPFGSFLGQSRIDSANGAVGWWRAASSSAWAIRRLYWRRLPLPCRVPEAQGRVAVIMRGFQSGIVHDYITWLVTGLAGPGGALALIIRCSEPS